MRKYRRQRPSPSIRPRLYGCTPLSNDEALSSWIMLVAVAKRWPVKEILKSWSYRIPGAYEADISRHIPPLSAMASMTFESGIRLADAHWAGETVLADPRYSCLTTYDDGPPIHLYCPSCLAKDKIPYLRRKWRLGYQFVCETHREQLYDHCPHCRRRIDYSRFFEDRPKMDVAMFFRCCPSCGFDLARTRPVRPEEPSFSILLKAQEFIHRLVTSPFFRHPTAGTVSSTKILRSFLITDEVLGPKGLKIETYSGIDLRRLLLNHYEDVILDLCLSRGGL